MQASPDFGRLESVEHDILTNFQVARYELLLYLSLCDDAARAELASPVAMAVY